MHTLLRPTTIFYFIFYLTVFFIISPVFAASSDKKSPESYKQSVEKLPSENRPIEKLLPPEKKYKIITVQHQDYLPYTHAYRGFIETLKKSGHWDNITVEFYNAKSDLASLDKKIKEISKRTDIDLIFTIGTQSTKKVTDKIKNIPVIFTVVGSPIEAKIIKKWKSSGRNVTGIGTPYQVTKSIAQAHGLAKFNTLGITYLDGSPNHEAAIREIKEFCKKNGVKLIHHSTPFKNKDGKAFPDDVVKAQLQESLDYILPKVDVFYVQASATYEKNFTIFRRAFQKYKVPSIGELIFIRKGIVMGVGPNDYVFGEQAADYAIKIIFDGVKPSELPMDTGTKFTIFINVEAAKVVELPFSIIMPALNSADAIYQKMDEW